MATKKHCNNQITEGFPERLSIIYDNTSQQMDGYMDEAADNIFCLLRGGLIGKLTYLAGSDARLSACLKTAIEEYTQRKKQEIKGILKEEGIGLAFGHMEYEQGVMLTDALARAIIGVTIQDYYNMLLEAWTLLTVESGDSAQEACDNTESTPVGEHRDETRIQPRLPELIEVEEYLLCLTRGESIFSVAAFDEVKQRISSGLEEIDLYLGGLLEEVLCSGYAGEESEKSLYMLKRIVAEDFMMAEELSAAFVKITNYYHPNEKMLKECENNAIIYGVYETVVIKLNSIQENKEAFQQSMEEEFEQFMKEWPIMTEQEFIGCINDAKASTAEALFNRGRVDKAELISYLTESRWFISYKERLAKFTATKTQSIRKMTNSYRKDYLLFEVSTYEEIMNYSISRLKEAEDSLALEFVSVCEGVFNEVEIIIKKNNVIFIRPKPHDVFNGKEHEVLMAEKNDEFNKGEIIKLMNSGYKQDDVIIIRANVIAAK